MAVDLVGRIRSELEGRYVVEREVGRGSMATIYLAQDLRHERPVALKVLRPELSAHLGAERFLREIKLIAKLQHPHILPLYDSGDCGGGCLFYVSPYVGDETLRHRLRREGSLPVGDAMRLAEEIADALAYAHAHGVVHRDIKPENILVSDDHALVADFGIARAIRLSGGRRLSEPGLSMGTPTYMSPEQASGELHIDGRSDVYSLGCVLYEMIAGRPPFVGTTERQVIAMHFTEPPPAIARPNLPRSVEYAVARALAKNPADRFQSADDFGRALMLPDDAVPDEAVAVPRSRRRSVAVVAAILMAGAAIAWLLTR